MLTIQRHQSAMFAELAVDRFVDQMVAHLREHRPQHFAALGEKAVREVSRDGIVRARSYRIESEAGVGVFIQLMFVLGPGFDTDPNLPWASRCLLAQGDERTRIMDLITLATDHFQGPSAPRG